jgi:arylsulfatase
VTFTNHHVNAMVCTPSRSVIYTGQHIQHTKLFDNMDFPWMEDLSHDIPTLGDMLGEAGYYTAYKGKWHMSKALGTHDELALPQEKLTQTIEGYGFRDYVGIGDVIGSVQGGYLNDEMIVAQAKRWLRVRGQSLTRESKPWLLAVNIVNPHDVMFYNTDAPGQNVQDTPKPLMGIAREPSAPLYRQQWDIRLPGSRKESFDKEGRPAAHRDYQQARAALVGDFPNEDERWRRLLNYYFNCIQQTDLAVEGILDELDDLGLSENTIVVMTADHGELGGAHGTHGKGATAYREQNHVPLIVSHPGYPRTHGQQCGAVTSHLDLAPTLISWTGVDADDRARITRSLRGKDLTPLLNTGEAAGLNDLRTGSLYCYNMFGYLDSNLMRQVQAYLNAGGDRQKVADQGFKPDFRKRGAIRSVFDGRYRYSRYFSPKQFNQPRTLEGIFELNDVELFDLEADPDETQNLSREPKKHGELLLAMNDKMNALIEAEVGEPDDGRFLPGENTNWAAARFDP